MDREDVEYLVRLFQSAVLHLDFGQGSASEYLPRLYLFVRGKSAIPAYGPDQTIIL